MADRLSCPTSSHFKALVVVRRRAAVVAALCGGWLAGCCVVGDTGTVGTDWGAEEEEEGATDLEDLIHVCVFSGVAATFCPSSPSPLDDTSVCRV